MRKTIKYDAVLVENWSPGDMVEVILQEPDDFLKVKETLSRIGVASKKEHNTLYQSCHLLHKQGRYFILHFKELFLLDGKYSTLSENDIQRRNTIVTLLSDWGLVAVVDKTKITMLAPMNQIKVLPYREKENWNLKAKYTIGIKH